MSLILEALKKSERQRRLGESPSLGSPVMAVRRRRNLLPVLVVAIAIGLAALWWMQRESPPPASAANATAPAQVAVEMRTSPAAPAPSAAVPRTHPAAPAPNKATIPALAVDGQDSQREKIRSGELVAANAQANAAAKIKESEPVSAADPAAIAAAMADATRPEVAQGPKNPAMIAPSPAPLPVETKAAAGASAATETPATSSLKLMWELPLATRRSLPEIKLSMHVFATEPAQRFVIINGERRAEGDDFDGLKLIEIRTDGVVLEHDSVRFLYPRGGR